MTNQEIILIHTKKEKPKNCKIIIKDMDVFYKVAVSKDNLNALSEEDKTNVYEYLNELQEKIKEMGKLPLLVYDDFND